MNRSQIHWTHSILLAGAALLLASSVQAAGSGVYLEYVPGSGYTESSPNNVDYDTKNFGIGFALDTNVAKDQIFNYRLNLGYEHSKREWDPGAKWKFNGFTMNHTFGFGLYRSQALRLWAGPAIRLGVGVLDEDVNDSTIVYLNGGAGVEVGLNIHMGDRVSIALSGGYQYLYSGLLDADDTDYYATEVVDGAQHRGSVKLTFLFRSAGDRYESSKK